MVEAMVRQILIEDERHDDPSEEFRELVDTNRFDCNRLTQLLEKLGLQYPDTKVLAAKLFEWKCPLQYALYSYNEELIERMLELGSSVDTKVSGSLSALHIAADLTNSNNIMLLVDYGADINDKDMYQRTPLSHYLSSMCKKSLEIFHLLAVNKEQLATKDVFGISPFFEAMSCGDEPIIRAILKMDLDLSICDNSKQSFLFHLVANSNPSVFNVLEEFDSLNYDVNLKDNKGCTAMHLACSYENVSAVKFLIKKQANLNIKDGRNLTPLE